MSKDRDKHVFDIASTNGFDLRGLSLAHEIRSFLENLKDSGTSIDSGTGPRTADLWVKIGGVEYFVTVGPSNSQLIKEGKTREELGLPPLSGDGLGPTEGE